MTMQKHYSSIKVGGEFYDEYWDKFFDEFDDEYWDNLCGEFDDELVYQRYSVEVFAPAG